jgi:hypothetical protein
METIVKTLTFDTIPSNTALPSNYCLKVVSSIYYRNGMLTIGKSGLVYYPVTNLRIESERLK